MSEHVEIVFVSDTAAAFISPVLEWVLGMPISRRNDEDWTVEEVDHRIRVQGEAVCLVMHKGDYTDGVLQCGPRVSQAIKTASRVDKPWCLLLPLEDEVMVGKVGNLSIRLEDGLVIDGIPYGVVTSDVRFIISFLSRATSACQTNSTSESGT